MCSANCSEVRRWIPSEADGRYWVPNDISGNGDDRMYQVLAVPPPSLLTQSFDSPDLISYSAFSSPSLPSTQLPTHLQSIFFNFFSSPPSSNARSPVISLGQGPFQRIHHPRMSTTTSAASAPTLEKKPVKFSNLLLGAGLNLFEVTTLGQVWHPSVVS